MYAYAIFVAFVFGLLIGSFLNACAYRVPRQISVARGRSFCPVCKTQIKGYDNVPLVSWVVLRGRCRACGAPISPRYPIVEGLTGALFAVTLAVDGLHWVALPHLLLVAVLILVSDIDLEFQIIPDVVILPTAVVGLATMTALSLARVHEGIWYQWPIAGFGAALFLFAIAEIYERVRHLAGMGMGDVKMALCIGVFLGVAVIPALFIAFVAGAVGGIMLIVIKGESGKTAIPFGPFLAFGAIVAMYVGKPAIDAYLHFVAR
jgi:leader peptidase (prepilin peptidase)/N-methyltransferase